VRPPCQLIAAVLPALLLLLGFSISPAAGAEPAARGEDYTPIRVVVAVLPFRVHSAKPLD
jgi:hypothetical protein